MKGTFFVSCSIAVAFSAALYAASPDSQPLKIGYVDTERIMMGSLEYKEIDRDARYKVELKEDEGQKKLEELRKFEEELAVMSEDKRKPFLKEYRRKQDELLRFQQQSREEILERQSVDLKRIANKVKRTIATISRQMNMTLVLDIKPVLYLDRTRIIDLTDKVVEALNKEYEQEKEKLRRKMPKRVK